MRITAEIFNSLKSSLDFHNEDTEKQLVICLSSITYANAKIDRNYKKGELTRMNTDVIIDDDIISLIS